MRLRTVRAFAAIAFALALAALPGVRPQIAFACSCVAFDDPIREAAADETTAVFAGIAQPPGARGDVPIVLTRWFKGTPPAAVVLLDGAGFVDPFGGMCGTAAPTPGQEWIFVAGPGERGTFGVSMCSPHGPVLEPHGKALLDAAVARYGPGSVAVADADDPPMAASGLAPELVLAGTLGAAGLVFVLAALAWRRSRGAEEPPVR